MNEIPNIDPRTPFREWLEAMKILPEDIIIFKHDKLKPVWDVFKNYATILETYCVIRVVMDTDPQLVIYTLDQFDQDQSVGDLMELVYLIRTSLYGEE